MIPVDGVLSVGAPDGPVMSVDPGAADVDGTG